MSRRKSNSPFDARRAPHEAPDRWRSWLLAATAALLAARLNLPVEIHPLIDGEGMPQVMLWCLTAVAAAALAWQRGWRIAWTAADWAFAALLTWHTASAWWAVRSGAPRPALSAMWEWLGLGLTYYVLRVAAPRGREARALVAGMLSVAAALAALGIYQHFVTIPETKREYAANPDATLAEAGLDFPPGSAERARFEDRLANAQPSATFTLTNSLAGFLAPWLVVAIGIAVAAWRSGSWRGRWAWGLAVAAALVACCLALTQSRSALLAAALGAAGAVLVAGGGQWILTRKALFAAGAAAVLAAVALAAVVGLGFDLFSGARRSLGYRFEYWESTLDMIREHPWLGCGPGNFQMRYEQYKLPQALEEVFEPHNSLLEVWATAGTPAALAFVGVLALWAWHVLRRFETGAEMREVAEAATAERSIAIGTLAGVPLAWLTGLFSSGLRPTEELLLCLLVGAAVLWSLWPWAQSGRWPRALGLLAGGALLVNLLAASGIGVPAVAQSLWLLMALGLNEATPCTAHVDRDAPPDRPWRGTVRLLTVGALIAAAVACYATAYRPVLESQAELRRAAADRRQGEEHLLAAAAADPRSAEPWLALAQWRFQRWQAAPGDSAWQAYRQAQEEALRLLPQASSVWLEAADRLMEGYRHTRDAAIGAAAIEYYRRAAALYPNDAVRQARLALALEAVGQRVAAAEAAAQAILLSKSTPHREKQLPAELLKRLARIQQSEDGGSGPRDRVEPESSTADPQ
jgi:O-antigen ligase